MTVRWWCCCCVWYCCDAAAAVAAAAAADDDDDVCCDSDGCDDGGTGGENDDTADDDDDYYLYLFIGCYDVVVQSGCIYSYGHVSFSYNQWNYVFIKYETCRLCYQMWKPNCTFISVPYYLHAVW